MSEFEMQARALLILSLIYSKTILSCFYAEDGVPRSSRSMSLTVGKVFLQYKEN